MAVLDGDGNRKPTPPNAEEQGLFNEYSAEDESAIDYLNKQAAESPTGTYSMDKDDIHLALKPHATSKIYSTEDLFSISTLGITECVPTLEEMFCDDLAYDIYKELVDSEDEQEILDAAFYTEVPDLTLGYRDSDHTFVLEYDPGSLGHLQTMTNLNMVDGDTTKFKMSGIKAIPGFEINGTPYNSFNDYCKAFKIIGLNGESDSEASFSLRSVGIDCPEIPHYEIAAIKKGTKLEKMTINAASTKDSVYLKYKINGTNVTERPGTEEATFYKNGSTYVEVIGKPNDALKYFSSSSDLNTDEYDFYQVAGKDESVIGTVSDGLKAKELYYNTLKNAKKIYLKLDANGVMASKTSSSGKLYYNYWWNGHKVIATMVDQWKNAMRDNAPITRLSFSPYGLDAYGRFLGEVYAEVDINGKSTLINVNKYVLAKTEHTEGNPTFIDSVEQNNVYGNTASSFELWTYKKDNRIYLDSMSEQSKNSYNGRLQLHKEITGIDFTAFRSCTMMLGDTLFLIPPTNIRNTSSVEYEKVGILRGKGSMVKGLSAREQYLEIDLYFYDEYGINGIPYTCKLPNGQEITYYMDGLLSLLAQFKVAPYLPIENQYINDVLGIEAVSLVNISYSTIEEYPRLLKATLVLRDFNYHIYMPDVPLDIKDKEEQQGGTVVYSS